MTVVRSIQGVEFIEGFLYRATWEQDGGTHSFDTYTFVDDSGLESDDGWSSVVPYEATQQSVMLEGDRPYILKSVTYVSMAVRLPPTP